VVPRLRISMRIAAKFWMGVGTPWTLASERVWNDTPRLAGKTFVAAGMGGVIVTLLALPLGVWMGIGVGLILLGALIPVVSSLVLYKRLEALRAKKLRGESGEQRKRPERASILNFRELLAASMLRGRAYIVHFTWVFSVHEDQCASFFQLGKKYFGRGLFWGGRAFFCAPKKPKKCAEVVQTHYRRDEPRTR